MTSSAEQVGGGAVSRTDRLDALSFNRAHGRLLVGAGVGWALDAMDVGLISFVMVALATQWHLDSGTLSGIASIGFVGMAIGAGVGGLLADRIGRRQVFALTLLVYGLATGASALAGSVAVLMALRFLVGLGLGAELPVASTLVSEYSPVAVRGRMVVALESFWAVGWILAALVGYLVVPSSPDGWRWALAVGVVPTIYAVVVRWGLPESVRFLEGKGRHAEAERAVRTFEAPAGITHEEPLPTDGPAGRTEPAATPRTKSRAGLWTAEYRRRTAALWVVWFMVNLSYYGAFIWLPTFIAGQGYGLVKSFEYTLVITLAQIPGYALSAWLIEVWGRRPTLASFLVGSAGAAALFGVVGSGAVPGVQGVGWLITAGCLLSFFNLGAWGALYAVSPEIYPTRIRSTGAGAAAAFGRIASILAPIVADRLVQAGGQGLVFAVFGVAFAIAAVAAAFLPELHRVALEE
ncbi:MFS transporter [Mobilicoccus pelagius]|uniref:Putative major facilitator superfamily transporter n=1 Tax=Mobilicoccus pelagius NBRC 104925 TaxID=1089455 RepID=H5UQA0_9MICO|nr:MFS transporter [Mobilicoccus pelagius]GAB47908.1 putative major facilitator superfamily transporter [Mobilicoccus pelagius NBRC 104925]